eukprot:m.92710 g.92710  ORF g.92710 m.92710 type:complete len:479 (-) comp9970_c0_seq2:479-1915(-)
MRYNAQLMPLILFGVSIVLTLATLSIMHSRMLALQTELDVARSRLTSMQEREARRQRSLTGHAEAGAVGRVDGALPSPSPTTSALPKGSRGIGTDPIAPGSDCVAAVGNQSMHARMEAGVAFAGYKHATDAANAVRRGIDVRLVQDGVPLRPHTAHAVPDPSEIQIPFEKCNELIAKGVGQRPLRALPMHLPQHKLHWLHIPKCGSSFGAVLYGLVCQAEPSPDVSPYTGEPCDYCGPRAKGSQRWDAVLYGVIDWAALPYCNWNVTTSTPRANYRNHVPLPLDHRAMRDWEVMGLFREPRRRLVSGWNHDKHAMGIAGDDRVHFEQSVTTIEEYVAYRAIPACATKMLIGAYCARTRNITVHAFDEAIRRLQAMAFVGLTDAFDASACLFCRMFNVTPQPFMFGKRAHARPGQSHHSHQLPGGGQRVPTTYAEQLDPAVDPLDHVVYEMAKQLFMSRLQQYGLWDQDYRMLERGIQA